jgi:4-hydroxythreonine-4-phosphate dehydrogenase
MSRPIHILVTEGDPAGIGPEIIAKALAHWQRPPDCRITILGYPAHFAPWRASLMKGVRWGAGRNESNDPGDSSAIDVQFPAQPNLDFEVQPGRAQESAAKSALAALDSAIDLVLAGEADAICTAPINKETMRLVGFDHPGHTEYLAERAGVRDVAMMLIGGGLKVVLATVHIPLANVAPSLSQSGIGKVIELTHASLRDYGILKPRIGVAGLNPHAGESGLFGSEEAGIIGPAIEEARRLGIDARGPISADTLFYRARQGEFDACIAMYHDQGLIPVKTLDFHGGVNMTLGLPFVRTSPDHGTAYELAGKEVADPRSMMAALQTAYAWALKRKAAASSIGTAIS